MRDIKDILSDLCEKAWQARENAYAWKSGTKVGCAIKTTANNLIPGWNTEGLWMTSIHAEVCAISQLGNQKIYAIAIVAETDRFTPCGACLDWIFQFGTNDTKVVIQNKLREMTIWNLSQLMPYYPRH